MVNPNQRVIPGVKLGERISCIPGEGTYLRDDGIVCASRCGTLLAVPDESTGKIVYSVARDSVKSVLPKVNSIVMGRISKMSAQQANVEIMFVDDLAVKEPFNGTIRKQDVRSFEKDTVDLSKCFVPGDIVRAEVISLGDAFAYYLSTAKNELGVVYAESVAGAQLIPISWEQMECSKTKNVEYRKCAKP